MKNLSLWLCLTLLAVFTFSVGADAVIVNPDPGTYANDDGTEYFHHANSVLNIELKDAFGEFGVGSLFGFFFQSDPSTQVTIFGPEDQDPDPGGAGSILQSATIDFLSGTVTDNDEGSVQDTFSGSGNVAFFLTLDPNSVNDNVPDLTLYTVAALNPGGADSSATFHLLADPSTYLIGFEETGSSTLLGYNFVQGVTPVPEPSTLLLVGSGLLGVMAVRRRKQG